MQALSEWDEQLERNVFVAACGGTALTLYGHKESTKDVDLLVPDPDEYGLLIDAITKLGYRPATGNGYRHPERPWIFDLFRGQTIFQTELLEPVQAEGRHRIIKKFRRLVVACVNPDDLIISKMFRGTMVDVQDSLVMIQAEKIDLRGLANRYHETAGYYFNPEVCKKNLEYLIAELKRFDMEADPLIEILHRWTV